MPKGLVCVSNKDNGGIIIIFRYCFYFILVRLWSIIKIDRGIRSGLCASTEDAHNERTTVPMLMALVEILR